MKPTTRTSSLTILGVVVALAGLVLFGPSTAAADKATPKLLPKEAPAKLPAIQKSAKPKATIPKATIPKATIPRASTPSALPSGPSRTKVLTGTLPSQGMQKVAPTPEEGQSKSSLPGSNVMFNPQPEPPKALSQQGDSPQDYGGPDASGGPDTQEGQSKSSLPGSNVMFNPQPEPPKALHQQGGSTQGYGGPDAQGGPSQSMGGSTQAITDEEHMPSPVK